MKVAPIHHAFEKQDNTRHIIIDCGYLDKLYAHDTYRQLNLPDPVVRYPEPNSAIRRLATRELVGQLRDAIESVEPDHLLVYGDLDSSLAAAIAATGCGLEFTHVEAGLRSYDYFDREETNRLAIDRLATLYVTHSVSAMDALRFEATDGDSILLSASPAVETLFAKIADARATVPETFGLTPGSYCLASLHRYETLRDEERFSRLIGALASLSDHVPVALINYRSTASMIARSFAGIENRVTLIPTLSYLDYLGLLRHASIVVTDSSGLQDETAVLGIPCVTCRTSTHRVQTEELGNRLVGFDPEALVTAAIAAMIPSAYEAKVPAIWHRSAGADIVTFLCRHLTAK